MLNVSTVYKNIPDHKPVIEEQLISASMVEVNNSLRLLGMMFFESK